MRRPDISSVLVIGSGPIVIGQACEFDYSGTQAIRVLKKEGIRIILVNSNPATIMTDPEMADATYIEPITCEVIEKIILKEKPDAILCTVGGQTALNCGLELYKKKFLDKHNVKMIGASYDAIQKAENRKEFSKLIKSMGLNAPKNSVVASVNEAMDVLGEIGLPAIIRPSFTLGGRGGGIARNVEEYKKIVQFGLTASLNTQVLIDQSVLGWKECELEVIRDKNSNCIIVCSIENIDPMGIHTGDSITVSPILTLTDKQYQSIRTAAIDIMNKIKVEGGANVQFAIDPYSEKFMVIEMNPRVSRSSALASKVTGFPIAKVSTLLSIGYTLDEVKNDITKTTPASFEPTLDYVVTKIPKFNFEKFDRKREVLNTSMQAVGEVIGIGRNFLESLNKAVVAMEESEDPFFKHDLISLSKTQLLSKLEHHYNDRLFIIACALRKKATVEEIYTLTKIDKWFLRQIETLIALEKNVDKNNIQNRDFLLKLKNLGVSDKAISSLAGVRHSEVLQLRKTLKIEPVYKIIDTCGAEFSSTTPYLYSCYEKNFLKPPECEANPSKNKKVIIIGSGPNRIGQGIEFDYTCVQAINALKKLGIEAIMINSNPETVSTDYDVPNKLYVEALTDERVFEIIKKESSKGQLLGVIVQLGGQTSLKLSSYLQDKKVPILGTPFEQMDLAEDRGKFQKLVSKLGLNQPKNTTCELIGEIKNKIKILNYPVLIRPSNVLGGRAMECLYSDEDLNKYLEKTKGNILDGPILIDSFLENATEVDVDAICDAEDVYIGGIMEHIEKAGVHSGDSACILPPYSIDNHLLCEIKQTTSMLAKALKVVGFINIQYAIQNNKLYVLEVNPRASRSLPFVCKSTGLPLVFIATQLMLGKKIKEFNLKQSNIKHFSIKETVLPFARIPNSDILLGSEMKSTGECMGWGKDVWTAFSKSQISAYNTIPSSGKMLICAKPDDEKKALNKLKEIKNLEFEVLMADNLQNIELDFIKDNNITMAFITNKDNIFLSLRRVVLASKICCFTTFEAWVMAMETIKRRKEKIQDVNKIQNINTGAF